MGATAEAPKGPPPPSPATVVHPTSQAEPRPLFPPGPPHVSRGDTLVSFHRHQALKQNKVSGKWAGVEVRIDCGIFRHQWS